VIEADGSRVDEAADVCRRFGAESLVIGRTVASHRLTVSRAGRVLVGLAGDVMRRVFFDTLEKRAR